MKFKITKKSKKSQARLGVIETAHGVLQTPAFFPVATQASVKTLTSQDIKEIGFEGILANTYHLYLRPGEKIIKKMGGLHKFMNFQGVIATDSGGFQVFSLGKGIEHKTGKLGARHAPGTCLAPSKPLVKITEEGVYFKSHLDGSEHFLSPEKSIQIQQDLGADIIFAFDQPSSPKDNQKETGTAMLRTHKWAEHCLATSVRPGRTSADKQGLFGIIQGGKFKELRKQSARFIAELNFDGIGIGGSFGSSYGDSKKNMLDVLDLIIPLLPEEKPRHLLGIGHPEDLEMAITRGIDLFDCVYPTRMARHGIAFTNQGDLAIMKSKFSSDKNPLDKQCSCPVCQNYSRSYIYHLIRAKEITGMRLLTYHNLWHFKKLIDKIRDKIENGKL